MRLRKAFLWTMIVSLCLAALLGIVALLLPNFVRNEEQVLFSTVLFGLYSLLALCCAIVMDKGRLVRLMWVGIAGAAAGLGLWLVVIWFDPLMDGRTEENVVRAAGTFTTPAVLFAQCGLLLLPRLVGTWAALMRRGTIIVSAMLAAAIVLVIWWGGWIEYYIDDDLMVRCLGVMGILTACGTSWHAALLGEYLIEEWARIPVEVEYASELRYRNPPVDHNTLVFAIS
ncbi:MAG: SIS domain-containing protein, partial [Pseudomonadales bacterium]